MSRVLKEVNALKSFVKKQGEVLETKILDELERYSLEPVRGKASPFLAKLKEMVKKQVEEEIESELAALNHETMVSGEGSAAGDTSRRMTGGSRRNTLLGSRHGKGMDASAVEETVMRILSEKGFIMSLITIKDLVEKFGRHE